MHFLIQDFSFVNTTLNIQREGRVGILRVGQYLKVFVMAGGQKQEKRNFRREGGGGGNLGGNFKIMESTEAKHEDSYS